MLYLNNFSNYNQKFGWNEGDIFLQQWSKLLVSMYSKYKIFRIYGDDFIILHDNKVDICETDINNISLLKEHKLVVSLKYVNIVHRHINSLFELEHLLMKSEEK